MCVNTDQYCGVQATRCIWQIVLRMQSTGPLLFNLCILIGNYMSKWSIVWHSHAAHGLSLAGPVLEVYMVPGQTGVSALADLDNIEELHTWFRYLPFVISGSHLFLPKQQVCNSEHVPGFPTTSFPY